MRRGSRKREKGKGKGPARRRKLKEKEKIEWRRRGGKRKKTEESLREERRKQNTRRRREGGGFDLYNSLGICYRRVSLAPAREFEVKANCFNFGVSSGDATQILSCLILVLPLVFGRGGYGEKQFSTKG